MVSSPMLNGVLDGGTETPPFRGAPSIETPPECRTLDPSLDARSNDVMGLML